MELIGKTHFDFVGWRMAAYLLSGLLMVISLLSLLMQGLNFGIDFSGGTLVQVQFTHPVPVGNIRTALSGMDLGDVVIQEFGAPEEILIRVERRANADDEGQDSKLAQAIAKALEPVANDGQVNLRRVEFVGPQVGHELSEKGAMAMIYSLVAILLYVAWRFEFRFAYGAVLALGHDVLITLGFFSVLQKEFTLVVVAALLTVVGYSLNDTIVVYDRIREEMKRLKRQPLAMVINLAINETLSRTLMTSLTTILVLIALLIFGGEVIHDFALTLLFGVVVGTYSSIFVASPIVLLLERRGGQRNNPPASAQPEPEVPPAAPVS
jgi:preprotein translocase subunit SecF